MLIAAAVIGLILLVLCVAKLNTIAELIRIQIAMAEMQQRQVQRLEGMLEGAQAALFDIARSVRKPE